MKKNILTMGITNTFFYMIEKVGTYYSLYITNSKPKDFKDETITEFLKENETDGSSTSGDIEDIIRELKELILFKTP